MLAATNVTIVQSPPNSMSTWAALFFLNNSYLVLILAPHSLVVARIAHVSGARVL